MPIEMFGENPYPMEVTEKVAARYRKYWAALAIPPEDLAKYLHRLSYPGGPDVILRTLEQAASGVTRPSSGLVAIVTGLLAQKNLLNARHPVTWRKAGLNKWIADQDVLGYWVTISRYSPDTRWVAAVSGPGEYSELELIHGVSDANDHKKNAALYVHLELEAVEARRLKEQFA